MHRRRRLLCMGLVAATVFTRLLAAGPGALTAPMRGGWSGLDAWYQRVGAAAAAIELVRLVAMAGAVWLVAGTSVQLLAVVTPRTRWQAWADAVTPASLRWAVNGVARLSVTAGLAVPTVATAPRDDPPGVAVMEVLDDSPTTTTTTPAPPSVTPPRAPAAPVPTPVDDEVVVAPGDSFWSIAVEAVADQRGRPAVDDEVVGYWQRLVDANRAVLVHPGNPDLLYAGQTLRLPAA